ncbi:unnamed protein product [Mytilus edulis]|uniref:OTU domain-containing protein n=1 Tax=Mytilus edulis TaxID=6550 RepID=A0A8S3R083_MYTED|nr:unnamed protein product [Mytilus edulis]
MTRTYVRKTNRGTTPHGIMERAMSCVVNEHRSVRSAASEFEINHMTLTRFIKKCTEVGSSNVTVGYFGNRKVFNDLQEQALERYLLNASYIYFGLTPKEVRRLAYECAEKFSIHMPQSWVENKCAGVDWFLLFMRRHPNLSIRTPEATSLSRATSFNHTNVNLFFTKLGEVMDRYKFNASDIWNIDETGITTVQKPSKTVGAKGVKQVGGITSAERGYLVTVCGSVNAIGNTVPPMMIFPRKHFKDHFIRDGPQGVCGGAHPSGWMTAENFLIFLQHFVKHTKPSTSHPVLLLLDNHNSHLAVTILAFAKLNGIVMLSFPPHCSHKLQPLDRTVYGPLKRYVATAQDCWLRNNPGKPMTIYDLPGILRESWPNAATPRNIISGFRVSGIFPMNPDVFEDTDFAPSYVTDRPMQTSSDDLTQREQMSDESPPAVPNSNTNEKESNNNQPEEADEQHEGEKSNEEQDKTDNNQEQRSDPNEESNLQKYLQERQRVLVNVRGDGHCLVYAFQICMEAELNEKIGTEEIFQNLRVEANRNKNFYKDFITDDQDLITEVNSYIDENNYMSGTADLILVLSCNAYQVFANIITVENNNISQLTQLPTTSSADRERNIYLVLTGQHAAAHYSATVREIAAGHRDHRKKKQQHHLTQAKYDHFQKHLH